MRAYRSRCKRERRGYTLIELLLVITLLGLAGAMLVPHMVDGDSMQLQAAVRQIIGDLSFAQSDALANQERRRVHFYDDGRGYCVVRATAANYGIEWGDLDPADIEYVHDPLAGSGELGRYIMDFNNEPRYREVQITSVELDGRFPGDAEGDLIFDSLGGTLRPGNLPGTGGTIVVSTAGDSFTITVSPFTGKLTVSSP